MRRTLIIAFLLLAILAQPAATFAQRKIDFMVVPGAEGWNIVHRVVRGETVFMLSRRYHVPPAILADANGVSYNDALQENAAVVVPLGAFNMQAARPANMADARALYYKVRPEDNLNRISRHTPFSSRALAELNNLFDREVRTGQLMLVGWILYDATEMNPPQPAIVTQTPTRIVIQLPRPTARDTPKYVMGGTVVNGLDQPPLPEDTVVEPELPPIEAAFKEQTQDGQNLVWEKGTAAFFSLSSNTKGAQVYAFHDKAAKGAIIRVKNMNNGRIIFVKVLGPLPLTRQYYNCIIGLSSGAKAALGVRESKAFCELSYAGY